MSDKSPQPLKVFAKRAKEKFGTSAADMLTTRLALTIEAVRQNAHLVKNRTSDGTNETVNAIIFSARLAADMTTNPVSVAEAIHSAAKTLLPSEFRPAAPAPL